MAENREETNAKRWEAETEASVAPSHLPYHLQTPAQRATSAPMPSNALGTSRAPSRTPSRTPQYPVPPRFAPNSGNRRGGNQYTPTRNPSGNTPSRNFTSTRGPSGTFAPTRVRDGNRNQIAGRRPPARVPSSGSGWADTLPLITTQKARELEAKEIEKKLKNMYLIPLEVGADPVASGVLLWGKKDRSPMDLLGFELEALNTIRTDMKVWIEWKEDVRALKVSCCIAAGCEKRILRAIDAIRNTVEHAKATAISASPVYIVAIPTNSGIRALVVPRVVEPSKVTGLELTGEVSPEEKKKWKVDRPDLVTASRERFEEQLKKSILRLAPYKGWMRLRVHFGHVVFSQVHRGLKNGEYSFTDFSKMLKNPRTAGRFERQLDSAAIAYNVKKRILDWHTRYCPVEGSLSELKDVNFSNTEVIFLSTRGGNLRVEADIDRINTGRVHEYQIGPRRLFKDNATNKKMEITMIDVEKKVDWAVEVITDSSIEAWPNQLVTMIKNSVSTRTKVRKDLLGLEYPGVTPQADSGISISSLVVRSVIHFKAKDSGYIVEVAIYRTWEGSDTRGEPKMASSVSLYHPFWDDVMESIENTTKVRGWNSNLSDFFDLDYPSRGLPALRDEINTIQGFLSAAQQHVEEVEAGKEKQPSA